MGIVQLNDRGMCHFGFRFPMIKQKPPVGFLVLLGPICHKRRNAELYMDGKLHFLSHKT